MKKIDIEFKKESLLGMIESCYVYGGDVHTSTVCNRCDKYYGKPYIQEYYDILGKETTEALYEAKMKDLKENYKIIYNVYTDSEGCTYNSLVRISEEV